VCKKCNDGYLRVSDSQREEEWLQSSIVFHYTLCYSLSALHYQLSVISDGCITKLYPLQRKGGVATRGIRVGRVGRMGK
jgi:hypothetical protein